MMQVTAGMCNIRAPEKLHHRGGGDDRLREQAGIEGQKRKKRAPHRNIFVWRRTGKAGMGEAGLERQRGVNFCKL